MSEDLGTFPTKRYNFLNDSPFLKIQRVLEAHTMHNIFENRLAYVLSDFIKKSVSTYKYQFCPRAYRIKC